MRGRVDDPVGVNLAQRLYHQQLELDPVVHQLAQIKQAPVDDVLTHRTIVLQEHWTVVLAQAQRFDAPAARLATRVFGSQEADAQQRVEVLLDQRLQQLLQVGRVALQFIGLGSLAEQLDVAHRCMCLKRSSTLSNAASQSLHY